MSERPGVMLYFDTIEPVIRFLSRESFGDVIAAVVSYCRTGEYPSLDETAQFAFETLLPQIKRDEERYAETCRRNRYSRYCGIEKQAGRKPLDYEAWLTSVDERQPPSTNVTNMNWNPNRSSNSNENLNCNSTAIQSQLERQEEGEGETTLTPTRYEPGLGYRTGNRQATQAEIDAHINMKRNEQQAKLNALDRS